jgi:lipoate-protein ligase A
MMGHLDSFLSPAGPKGRVCRRLPATSSIKIDTYRADETLLRKTQKDRQRRIAVYVPRQLQVVIGRGSDLEAELNVRSCVENGVPLFRRRGGGCAVVLDSGNVVVAVAEHAPGFGGNKAHLKRLSEWLRKGLEELGVRGLKHEGISDLAWGDRKVAGSCLHRSRDTLLYSATLLVNPDLSLMERYLKHPPREPGYRNGRPHRDFVGQLTPHLWPGRPGELARRLAEVLSDRDNGNPEEGNSLHS